MAAPLVIEHFNIVEQLLLRVTVTLEVLAERFPSYSEAKMALFDYIEVFYNQRRRHSTLGQISPAAFERQAAA